jgi:hypothetical protein
MVNAMFVVAMGADTDETSGEGLAYLPSISVNR